MFRVSDGVASDDAIRSGHLRRDVGDDEDMDVVAFTEDAHSGGALQLRLAAVPADTWGG